MPSTPEETNQSATPPSLLSESARLVKFWFGISDRVRPLPYAASGLGLGLFKYGVEALVMWKFSSTVFWPWDFINPMFSVRSQIFRAGPEWLPWMMFLWTLPFMWVAVTMSVRRAADAGSSPWFGLLMVIPILNYFFMLWGSLAPSEYESQWSTLHRAPTRDDRAKSAARWRSAEA